MPKRRFKQHHAFDPEGIFIGDASYLVVPDNDKYEGSSRLLFDEHNLESFSSRSFSLIVNQVVFVLLTYSLLQWYLLRIGRRELNTKTRTRTLDLLRPAITMVLIYYKSYVAYLSPLEHQELVLTLNEQARKKILAKTRKLRRSLASQLANPRAP